MDGRMKPVTGQLFIDKQGIVVQFITAASVKEKDERIAVYQELSGGFGIYALNFEEFLEKMAPHSYVEESIPVTAEKNDLKDLSISAENITSKQEIQSKEENSNIAAREKPLSAYENYENKNRNALQQEEVHPLLLAFLDADSYADKLNVLTGGRRYLNDKLINHMAISIDCIVDEGSIEERTDNLIYCLKTHARFEDKRLR